MRGATEIYHAKTGIAVISIHAPREGSDLIVQAAQEVQVMISIHAPREGSDGGEAYESVNMLSISIHAPREGSDHDAYHNGDKVT